MMRALNLFLLCGAALAFNGCAEVNRFMGSAFMISPAEEIKLGGEFRDQIEKNLKFVNDAEIMNYVQKVGGIVTANAPQASEIPVRFHVVRNDEINAFAIPGGDIYVHTGLIDASDDEAEMASVIAHEYGHVVYRHGARHISRAQSTQLLEQLVLGSNAGALAQIAADSIASGALQKFSREDELEADSIAIPTLYRAGYDPKAMASFFETLKGRYGDSSGMATLFNSHPATGERIARVEASVSKLPPKAELYRPVTELRKIQGRMRDLGLSAAKKK